MSDKEPKENSAGEDKVLVRKVLDGDSRAFEALVLKYEERVFRLISRLLGRRENVEDLAQEVFLRAYRSLGGFKGESSFYTWLYKITLNTCRNYYRSIGRRPEGSMVAAEHIIDTMASGIDSPEKEVFRLEFWERVRSSLDDLPDEQREAVVMCDLEGMSYEEMAGVIGIPVGTVRSRVFRGRRALQAILSPHLAERREKESRH